MLPNLIVIGAPKSGTTSLHAYLALHPEISMVAEKELHYFVRDDWKSRVDWYEAHFPEGTPIRGEASPSYTMYPFRRSTAERIQALIPDAKLIYIARDPVERAIANYIEFFALGHETRRIDEALTDFEDSSNPHLCPSRYATQLQRFQSVFPDSQTLVLDQVDLLNRRRTTLRSIFDFLGVDPNFYSSEFERTHNVRSTKVRYNRLGGWLVMRQILTARRVNVRAPLVWPLRPLLSHPIDATLSASCREALTTWFRPEVERLRELTGMPFASWNGFP